MTYHQYRDKLSGYGRLYYRAYHTLGSQSFATRYFRQKKRDLCSQFPEHGYRYSLSVLMPSKLKELQEEC